jgi:S-adenosylmethionine:diacylglycerol 3-amino-3-carboxypropyl transferase
MPITFTRAWEDDRLDAELLDVRRGETVLVVAAGGDAALVLASNGARVIAVDRNPDQLRLVALKIAAARSLDARTAYRWFEAGDGKRTVGTYLRQVRPLLAPGDAAFWDQGIRLVAGGLHTQTGVGRSFARLGMLVRLLQPALAREVERTPDTAAQLAWWRRHVRPLLDNQATHALAARTRLMAAFAPDDRELDRMRRTGWSHGLVDRIDGILASTLVREHPWWRPAFSGRAADAGHGAAWLDEDRLASLASGPDLTLVEGDLAGVLHAWPAGSISAISVSNVPDWLDDDACRDVAVAVREALAPGGRVLVRRVVAPVEDTFERCGLLRDPVSDTLPARDRTALYESIDLYRRTAGDGPALGQLSESC